MTENDDVSPSGAARSGRAGPFPQRLRLHPLAPRPPPPIQNKNKTAILQN